MSTYQGPIFDADNHFYEAHDAFTRHVPLKMRSRCVEWVELEGGRKYHMVGGRIDRSGSRRSTPSPNLASCGSISPATPRGMTTAELIRSSLEQRASAASAGRGIGRLLSDLVAESAGGDDGVLEDEVDNLVVSDRGDGSSVEGDEPPTDQRAMVTVPSLS